SYGRACALVAVKADRQRRGEPVAWAAVHFGGRRDGKIYTTCDTREQIEAYIQDVHQSSDSLTLRARPLAFADAPVAAQAQPSMPALTDAMRAVIRNEHDVYGNEDALYAALCAAAQTQPLPDSLIPTAPDLEYLRSMAENGALPAFLRGQIAAAVKALAAQAQPTANPNVGAAAQARRIYMHVQNGGFATATDIGRMVET